MPDSHWTRVEPMLFRYDGPGEQYLAFRAADSGHVAQFMVGIVAADKLDWYEGNAFQMNVAADGVALENHRDRAGTAASLLGAMGPAVAALATGAVGAWPDGTALPLTASMALCA